MWTVSTFFGPHNRIISTPRRDDRAYRASVSAVQQAQQRRILQQNVWLAQRAAALAAAASGDPSLADSATSADPTGTFVERVRQMSPRQRRVVMTALGQLTVALLALADYLARSGAVTAAKVTIDIAVAVFALFAAMSRDPDRG